MFLIRSGRVVLLLNGYDEMAQFMNARERRSCLSALAELSTDGARGLITSRPNYFTESEELNVFESLYSSIEQSNYYLSQSDKLFLAQEKEVDSLIERHILSRSERNLRDLDYFQTESLVRRKLAGDERGQDIILRMLRSISRDETDGIKQSLSGKPVIISYLLELIDDLRNEDETSNASDLTEWQVYKLIVDRLMLRDLQRSPSINPAMRRLTLQKLALIISGKDTAVAGESEFFSIIENLFKTELHRLTPDERRSRREELFQDMRSSTTLTRTETGRSGWIFSHNSLREYLVSEYFVANLVSHNPAPLNVPVTAAMRSFVASLKDLPKTQLINGLRDVWPKRKNIETGKYLSMAWDLLRRNDQGLISAIKDITGGKDTNSINLDYIQLDRIELSVKDKESGSLSINARSLSLSDSRITGIDMSGSNFERAVLDRIIFSECIMANCDFSNSLIFECELDDTIFSGSNFRGLDDNTNFIVKNAKNEKIPLYGKSAIGYLNFNGGNTDEIEPFYIYQHHPKFPIVFKICENIQDQRKSQWRGLTQRGVAQSDPPFARAFVDELKASGLIEIDQNELVSATPEGRRQIPLFIEKNILPDFIVAFLRDS
jgi:hypothetical protein